jgi:hypothetical protein
MTSVSSSSRSSTTRILSGRLLLLLLPLLLVAQYLMTYPQAYLRYVSSRVAASGGISDSDSDEPAVLSKSRRRSKQVEQQPGILPLLPWEMESVNTRICQPPNITTNSTTITTIPQYCCMGSTSIGGRSRYKAKHCDDKAIYKRVEEYAIEYLASNYKGVSDDDVACDSCRIVDLLLQHNLTLSFVGDSMTRQVGVGFECDLLRRGYAVTTRVLPWIKNKECGWRYCIGQKIEMAIQEPFFEDDDQRKTASIYHYGVYRPSEQDDNAEVKQHIIATSDIVVFDFGLHWTPLEASDFGRAMTSFLRGFVPDNNNNNNLTLLAWRETSAQHFNADGGHFGNERRGDTCAAIQDASEGFRFPLMKQAALDAGLTWTSPLNFSLSNEKNQPELVFLPFRDYTVPLHYLHPGECTHYCHSPHVWLPIWRTLRLAIDRAVRIKHQQHQKTTTS